MTGRAWYCSAPGWLTAVHTGICSRGGEVEELGGGGSGEGGREGGRVTVIRACCTWA